MLADLERARHPSPPNVVLPRRRRGGDVDMGAKAALPSRAVNTVAVTCAAFLLCLAVSGSLKLRFVLSMLAIAAHPATLYWGYARLRLYRYVQECSILRAFGAGFFLAIFASSYEQVAQFVLARCLGYVNSEAALAAHTMSFSGNGGVTGAMTVRSVAGSLAFLVLLSYGTTALVEEVVKLGASSSQMIRQNKMEKGHDSGSRFGSSVEGGRGRRRQRAMAAVSLAVAGASGFATIENIVYLLGPSMAQVFNDNKRGNAGRNDGFFIVSNVEHWNITAYRLIVVATLHVICGVLTGTNIARRDLVQALSTRKNLSTSHGTVVWCAVPAIFLHGSYDLLINILRAEELHSKVHHKSVLWGVGLLALAAGILSIKAAGDALQNELRAFVSKRQNTVPLNKQTCKMLPRYTSGAGSSHVV